jgi:hypothetical protein
MRNSLQVRESVGKCFFFQRGSITNYEALEFLIRPVARDPEREVKHRWTVLVKVYAPGWNRHVGNEIL